MLKDIVTGVRKTCFQWLDRQLRATIIAGQYTIEKDKVAVETVKIDVANIKNMKGMDTKLLAKWNDELGVFDYINPEKDKYKF